jgi:chromate transporter
MATSPQPSIARLFTSFLRLGVTAFGGPAMIAYIRRMAVEQKNWLDPDTFSDGVALCQAIPGATSMQTAAYVGLKTRGITGAAASFIGFSLPAFFLMMIFAALYTSTHNLPIVISAFSGLQAIIVAVIANAAVSFGKTTLKTWKSLLIAGFAAALFGLNVNPIFVILLAAAGGLLLAHPERTPRQDWTASAQGQSHIKPLLLILSVAAIGLLVLFFYDRTLFGLATLLLRIDLFAFGGGFASVPLIFHEIVEARHWMDAPTLMNGIILGQVTPGPIVITATFIGYLLAGPLGGVVSTLSIFLPSFVILVGIAPHFDRLRISPSFNKAIQGILGSFVGLLFTVTVRFALDCHWNLPKMALASIALVALLLRVDILWVVIFGTIISVLLFR